MICNHKSDITVSNLKVNRHESMQLFASMPFVSDVITGLQLQRGLSNVLFSVVVGDV